MRVFRLAIPLVIGTLLLFPMPSVAQAEEQTPQVGECTTAATTEGFTLKGKVVSCTERHTGRTVYVGKWTSAVSPAKADSLKGDARAQVVKDLSQQYEACDRAVEDFIGARTPTYVKVSRFSSNLSGPNAKEWAAGQRWTRCDLVLLDLPTKIGGSTTRLERLPKEATLKGYLSRTDGAYSAYKFCYQQDPKDEKFYPFKCWSGIVAVARVTPDHDYPGSSEAAFKAVRKQCIGVNKEVWGILPDFVETATSSYRYTFETLTQANYRKTGWLCALPLI